LKLLLPKNVKLDPALAQLLDIHNTGLIKSTVSPGKKNYNNQAIEPPEKEFKERPNR